MRKLLCLLGFAWLMPGFAQTEPTSTYTLIQAQEYALKNGYGVTNKVLDYEKAKKTIKETASRGLPQVTADAMYTYNAKILGQPIDASFFNPSIPEGQISYAPFGVPHQTQANINVNQLIFDGSYFVALQATQVYKDIADLDVIKAKIDIKTDVANAYYGVLIAQESLKLAQKNVNVIESNFKETKALFENGFVEEQDADQLELLVNTQKNNLRNAQRQEELAMQLLKFNMGMSLTETISVTSTIEELSTIEESTPSALGNTLNLDNHIDYRIAQNNFKAAGLQLKNEKATYLPSVSGFLRHSQLNANNDNFNAFNYDTFWADGTSMGLSVNWTIFNGLGRSARVQSAKIDVQRSELAVDITNNQLRLNFEQAKSNYQFALDNYKTQKKNMEISEKIRNQTSIKYKEGLSSSLELTQTENQMISAQNGYLSAMQNLLTAKQDLIKATGQL